MRARSTKDKDYYKQQQQQRPPTTTNQEQEEEESHAAARGRGQETTTTTTTSLGLEARPRLHDTLEESQQYFRLHVCLALCIGKVFRVAPAFEQVIY